MLAPLILAAACVALCAAPAGAADLRFRVPVDVAIDAPDTARLAVQCMATHVPRGDPVYFETTVIVGALAGEERPLVNGRFAGTVTVDVNVPPARRNDVRGYLCRLMILIEDRPGWISTSRPDQWAEQHQQAFDPFVWYVTGEIGGPPQRTGGGNRPAPPRDPRPPRGGGDLTGGQRPRN